MEGDEFIEYNVINVTISIHALRVEGDVSNVVSFLIENKISIHALRVEGDTPPPLHLEGGAISIHALRVEGDKTCGELPRWKRNFYPRPPGGGRLAGGEFPNLPAGISIHALRVEGDLFIWRIKSINQLFLSTPSGWRATTGRFVLRFVGIKISIHALRVEGDTSHTADNGTSHGISIHALRVEGD